MMSTPYWINVEPITPESTVDSETDSASDFQDSGVFSGTEDGGDRLLENIAAISTNEVPFGSDRLPPGSPSDPSIGGISVPARSEYYPPLIARPIQRNGQFSWSLVGDPLTNAAIVSSDTGVKDSALPLSVLRYEESQENHILPVAHDAAAILRQSGAFLNNQLQSSRYLKTSVEKTSISRRGGSPNLGRLGTAAYRRKTPRKQAHPCPSPKHYDANFRGVVFKFRLRFLRRRQHRLLIKSKFCCSRRTSRCGYHKHESHLSGETSSSDSDREMATVRWHCREGKQCASCTTRKTPLWRDAEDGTPLCNACGIRYKKYRIRCVGCWYIPRKANKSYPVCLNCGDRVQHTYQARRTTFTSDR